MAIEGILERIAEDARAEAEGIAAEAEAEIARVREEGARRREALLRDAEARARKEAEEASRRLEVTLEREAAREILEEKQHLIDRVFERARERIAGLEPAAFGEFASRLLREAVRDGREEIILPEGEDRIGPEIVERVNRELRAAGREGALRIASERRPIGSGFILRSGRKETNCTIEAILEARREELEPVVARILFGGGGGTDGGGAP